jgi:glycosyltransferase involved in cell wall biosynthesis
MKILFDDWALPYLLKDDNVPVGGWAVELTSWIRGLEACACDVEVITWIGANDFIGHHNHVNLREAYRRQGGIRILKYFYHHIPAIVRAARQSSPDVVIQACSGIETAIMAVAAWGSGATFVHRLANDRDVDERIVDATRWYERWAFHFGMFCADAVVCQNGYQLDRVRHLYPKKPAIVLYNPFQVPDGASSLGCGSRRYIAWLANFGPAKNVPLLAKVAAENPDIEFRVAGAFSALATDETRAAVHALEALPNVRMMGYLSREQVPAFLANAKYLLSTSLFEGMSNTFLEALAVGTPILAPSRVDPDGILSRNSLGFVARNDDDLVRLPALVGSISDEEFQKLSGRVREYVREQHDPARLASRLLSFLESASLIGRRMRPAGP